jgi:hypothetical protein
MPFDAAAAARVLAERWRSAIYDVYLAPLQKCAEEVQRSFHRVPFDPRKVRSAARKNRVSKFQITDARRKVTFALQMREADRVVRDVQTMLEDIECMLYHTQSEHSGAYKKRMREIIEGWHAVVPQRLINRDENAVLRYQQEMTLHFAACRRDLRQARAPSASCSSAPRPPRTWCK